MCAACVCVGLLVVLHMENTPQILGDMQQWRERLGLHHRLRNGSSNSAHSSSKCTRITCTRHTRFEIYFRAPVALQRECESSYLQLLRLLCVPVVPVAHHKHQTSGNRLARSLTLRDNIFVSSMMLSPIMPQGTLFQGTYIPIIRAK